MTTLIQGFPLPTLAIVAGVTVRESVAPLPAGHLGSKTVKYDSVGGPKTDDLMVDCTRMIKAVGGSPCRGGL